MALDSAPGIRQSATGSTKIREKFGLGRDPESMVEVRVVPRLGFLLPPRRQTSEKRDDEGGAKLIVRRESGLVLFLERLLDTSRGIRAEGAAEEFLVPNFFW